MGRIVVDISDGVATATISAPPMNALTAAMRAELAERLQTFERDDAVRAIVLRGDGPKAFCAGFDVNEITASLGSAERTLAQFQTDAVLFDRLAHCAKADAGGGRGRGVRRRARTRRLLRFHHRGRARTVRSARNQARRDPGGRRHGPRHATDRAGARAATDPARRSDRRGNGARLGPDRARGAAGQLSHRRARPSRSALPQRRRVQCNMPSAQSPRRRTQTSRPRWRWRAILRRSFRPRPILRKACAHFLSGAARNSGTRSTER